MPELTPDVPLALAAALPLLFADCSDGRRAGEEESSVIAGWSHPPLAGIQACRPHAKEPSRATDGNDLNFGVNVLQRKRCVP